MGASPQTPANGGQSLPQWITPCYNGVGVEGGLLGGLLVLGVAMSFWAVWSVGLRLAPSKRGLASVSCLLGILA